MNNLHHKCLLKDGLDKQILVAQLATQNKNKKIGIAVVTSSNHEQTSK
mgnify:FL=1